VAQVSDRTPTAGERPLVPAPEPPPVRPVVVVLVGTALWTAALLLSLAVPALHTGDRSWWPWACAGGIALGAFGYLYVLRAGQTRS
jgi:hypothetical protein